MRASPATPAKRSSITSNCVGTVRGTWAERSVSTAPPYVWPDGTRAEQSARPSIAVVRLVVLGERTDDGLEECEHGGIEFAVLDPLTNVLEQVLGPSPHVAFPATDLVEVPNDVAGSLAEAGWIGLQHHDDAVDRGRVGDLASRGADAHRTRRTDRRGGGDRERCSRARHGGRRRRCGRRSGGV